MSQKYFDIGEFIIRAHEKGRTASDIADFMDISETKVHKIVKLYKETGSIEADLDNSHGAAKLDDHHKKVINKWLEADCSIPITHIVELLFETFGIRLASSTITNYLNDFYYTLKYEENPEELKNDEDTIQDRAAFARTFCDFQQTHKPKKFIFIDPFELMLLTRTKGGHVIVGEEKVRRFRKIIKKNLAIYPALEGNRCGLCHVDENKLDDNSTLKYIKRLCDHRSKMEEKESIVIVIKPTLFIISPEIKELVRHYGHYILILPFYSPFFIPKDDFYTKWRRIVHSRNPRNNEELNDAIQNAAYQVVFNEEETYHNNIAKYIPNCVKGEAIEYK